MLNDLPYVSFLTEPTGNIPNPTYHCDGCGHAGHMTEWKKMSRGMLWWRQTYVICPECGSDKYHVTVGYKPIKMEEQNED